MLDTAQHHDPALPEAPDVPATREAEVGPVRVSTAQIMGILRVAALATAAGLVLYLFSHEALLLFFAVLLGCSLRGAADGSGRLLHLPAGVMLGLISLLILGVIGGGLWYIGPNLVHQGTDLVGKLSGESDKLLQRYASTSWGQTIKQHMSGSMPSAGAVTAPAFKVAGLTLGALADLILVLITALYLAISPELYQRGMLRLVAIRHRPRALGIMREVGRTMRRWLLGQLIDMVVVGIITAVGLSLLHVPVPLALGVLAGLMTFVPYFGAALAGIPAVLVGALRRRGHRALCGGRVRGLPSCRGLRALAAGAEAPGRAAPGAHAAVAGGRGIGVRAPRHHHGHPDRRCRHGRGPGGLRG